MSTPFQPFSLANIQAVMIDLDGTTASGWLTDRIDPRKLLFAYYGLRGLSLIYLPFENFTFYGRTGSPPCRRP